MKESRRTGLLVISFLVISHLLFLLVIYPNQVASMNDLKAYGSAFQAFISGENPYDLAVLRRLQGSENPMVLYNPPLFLIIFAPILSFEFEIASQLLFLFDCFALVGTVLIVASLEKRKTHLQPLIFLILLCTIPVLPCVTHGQVSILLMSSLVFSLYFLDRRNFFLSGFLLAPLFTKPHFAYLGILAMLVLAIDRKRWPIGLGIFAGVGSLSLVAEVVHPGIHSAWFNRSLFPLHLFGSGIPSLVRSYLFSTSGTASEWPTYVFPMIAVSSAFRHYWKRGWKWAITDYRFLIPLSLLSTPYGFLFDQVLLVPVIISLIFFLKYDRGLEDIVILRLFLGLSALSLLTFPITVGGIRVMWNSYLVGFITLQVALTFTKWPSRTTR